MIRKVLFLCRRFPYPLDRGDNLRVFHLAEQLAREVQVRMLVLGQGPELPLDGVRVRTVGTVGGAKRALGPDWLSVLRGNLGARDLRLPLQVRATLDRDFERALQEEIADFSPDVVHASPSTMAPYLWSVDGAFHRHLDLMDAFSVVMDGDADNARQPRRAVLRAEARLLRRFEAAAVRRADSASLVSGADKELAPGLEKAVVVPQAVDPEKFPFADAGDRPPVLVFVGNLGWQPNVEAVTRIVRDVMPLVLQACPAARLRIVGVGGALEHLGEAPGVDVIGAVPSVVPELHGAACALIPMWSGAGMKNKALEAFAAGTPVVSNELGLKGIVGLEPGRHALVGEDPSALAAACVRLCTDARERARLATEAARFVRSRYTWGGHAQRLLELYGAGAHARA